jgi:hypothetical protein
MIYFIITQNLLLLTNYALLTFLNVGETKIPKHFATQSTSGVKYYKKMKKYIQNKQHMSVP